MVGHDPESGASKAYVGEADDVGKRLLEHAKDKSKDFWERGCFITSKDQNLTKAHARYLESRLFGIIKKSGRARLANVNNPSTVKLPEADLSDMEYFIDQIQLTLPVLGMDFLRLPLAAGSTEEVRFILTNRKHSIKAQAVERDDEFVLLKGSRAQPTWRDEGSVDSGYAQLHSSLLTSGRINSDNETTAIFSDDVPFNSPSAAAAVVLGSKANGRKMWRVEGTGTPYGEWQNILLDDMQEQSRQD